VLVNGLFVPEAAAPASKFDKTIIGFVLPAAES